MFHSGIHRCIVNGVLAWLYTPKMIFTEYKWAWSECKIWQQSCVLVFSWGMCMLYIHFPLHCMCHKNTVLLPSWISFQTLLIASGQSICGEIQANKEDTLLFLCLSTLFPIFFGLSLFLKLCSVEQPTDYADNNDNTNNNNIEQRRQDITHDCSGSFPRSTKEPNRCCFLRRKQILVPKRLQFEHLRKNI